MVRDKHSRTQFQGNFQELLLVRTPLYY